jgi:hypothetical protein
MYTYGHHEPHFAFDGAQQAVFEWHSPHFVCWLASQTSPAWEGGSFGPQATPPPELDAHMPFSVRKLPLRCNAWKQDYDKAREDDEKESNGKIQGKRAGS